MSKKLKEFTVEFERKVVYTVKVNATDADDAQDRAHSVVLGNSSGGIAVGESDIELLEIYNHTDNRREY